MANVTLNTPTAANSRLVRRPFVDPLIANQTVLSLHLSAGGTQPVVASLSAGAGAGTVSLAADMDQLHLRTNLGNAFSLSGVSFKAGGLQYVSKANGDLQINPSPITGNGTKVGTLTPGIGELSLDAWPAGSAPLVEEWRGVAGAPVNGPTTPFNTFAIVFRIATAPIRTGTFSVLGTMADGTTFNVSADSNGFIDEPRIKGRINYTTGVVKLVGVTPTAPVGYPKQDLSFLGIPGVTEEFVDLIRQETLRYNATAYTYLPLDADLLGIDPVRLPSDGRVPIFRPGELAVVGNTQTTTPANAVVNATVNVGRERLSRLRVLGADNSVIQTGYTEDLEAGTVKFTNITGYVQPVRIEHRVEDTGLIRDAQIDGSITFTRPMTHVYPGGTSYVSSCLRAGDLKARVPLVFDQATWNGVTFSDALVGDPAPGTFNATDYPITVKNAGAVTERWALSFKTSTTFQLIGEHVGNLGEFSILAGDIVPINEASGQPYMTIPVAGFGGGWASGNIVRINTVGAMFPFWMVRTVQQGPESASDYSFLTIVRGDVDNPIT